MKRITALCMAIVIWLGTFPVSVFAEDDAYQAYLEAAEKTTASGSWSEDLSMTADMEITYDTAKARTRLTLESRADVSGYQASDLSGLSVTGSAEMQLMGNVYTWDVIYRDGTVSIHYTSPGHAGMDTADDSVIFEFGSITRDMISHPRVTAGKITFTIPGDKMKALGMSAVSLTGADECRYGDVDVEILLNRDTGSIDTVNMRFHAAVTFNGAHAEADYVIRYGFTPQGTGNRTAALPEAEDASDWIAQHLEYASGQRCEAQIVSGYNSRMLRVFRTATDDNQIQSYQARKIISQLLKLDFELKENEMYELLLAQLMYGNTGLYTIEDTYARNLQISTQQTMAALAEILIESKDLPENTVKSIRQLVDALQALSYGSPEFDSVYAELADMIQNNAGDLKKEILGEACSTVLGIAVDSAFEIYDSMEDILTYIQHYSAYRSTSRQIIAVMEQLAEQTFVQYGQPCGRYQRGTYELADELGIWGAMINWPEFQEALSAILAELEAFEQDNADAIAQYAAACFADMSQSIRENALKKTGIFAAEQVMSCIPVLNAIVTAKKAAGVIVDASLVLEEIFTDIQDREFAVDLLVKAYCISVMLDETVRSCADAMTEDDLPSVMVFDAAVMMYRKNQQLALTYATRYVDMVLANSAAELKDLEKYDNSLEPHPDRALNEETKRRLREILTWYTQMRTLLSEESGEIGQICCHSTDLIPEQDPSPATDFETGASIYVITGPADVLVTSEAGTQMACLSAAGSQVETGYGSYFQTVPAGNGSGTCAKIAVVPDGYRVTLNGTGQGTLDAFVIDRSGLIRQAEAYLDVPVSETSAGHFATAFGGTDLVMDQLTYSGIRLPAGVSASLPGGAIAGACVIAVSLAFLVIKRKGRHGKRQ